MASPIFCSQQLPGVPSDLLLASSTRDCPAHTSLLPCRTCPGALDTCPACAVGRAGGSPEPEAPHRDIPALEETSAGTSLSVSSPGQGDAGGLPCIAPSSRWQWCLLAAHPGTSLPDLVPPSSLHFPSLKIPHIFQVLLMAVACAQFSGRRSRRRAVQVSCIVKP